MVFQNREQAGLRLAERLSTRDGFDSVVVNALPRGGVPIGYQLALRLNAPLDVLIVRKLGVPQHLELAMGAITTGGIRVLNEGLIRQLGITDQAIEEATARELKELHRRERSYRGERPPVPVEGSTVVVTDDGIATGATMRAAVKALRRRSPGRIVVAVPTAAPDTRNELARLADDVICLATPEPYLAVGAWYREFEQVSDEEVRDLLARAASRYAPANDATATA